jgi:CheY-like chemotaxis protein/tetratricopeptide (TPR) repeat protein
MAATILCADTDRQLFKILEKAFRDAGYRPIPAHDGEQALAAVEAESPALVVLDVSMPKRDGFQVLEAIRALDGPASETPVLLTCGTRITPKYEERAHALGAQGILAKPVPLADLLARVRQHVKAKAASSGRGAEKRREGLLVEGDLAEVEFPSLLHHLHGLRATGVLMIQSGKKRKAIQLRDGYPVAVKSNLINECLGNHLVRSGKLSAEAVQESLDRMQKGEGLQGQILVAMDVITEEEITAALREQAESKLYEIFEWKRGSFKFELGGRLRRGNTLALETSPANVILEGVRRWTPRERVDAFYDRNGKRPVKRNQSPFYRFQEVALSAAEQALVGGLDGARTLEQVVGSDDAMHRTFYGLVAAELLELGGEPAEVSETTRRRTTTKAPSAQPPRHSANQPEEDRQLRSALAAMAERLRGKSYFEMLQVSESASAEEIDEAYERLATKAHPDRYNNASKALRQLADEVFQLLTRAHDTLLDPKRRKAYESERKRGERSAVQQAKNQKAVQAEVEFQHGEALLRQRDYERALAHFTRARDASPKEGEYLAHYAWCFYLCNPDNATVVQEALAHMKRAVKMARDQEKPYLFLGRLCKVVGDGAGAEQMFTRAVQIRPDCVEAMRELRLINMRKDKGRGLIGRLLRR